VIPEYHFDNMKLHGNILTLFYTRTDNKKSKLKINLKKQPLTSSLVEAKNKKLL
jgi:hypothetical protein